MSDQGQAAGGERIQLALLRRYSSTMSVDEFARQLGPFVLLASPPDQVPNLEGEEESTRVASPAAVLAAARAVKERWNRLEAVMLPPLRETDELSAGRNFTNDVVLDDPTASKNHARVVWDGAAERCRVVDLGSRNGTRINGSDVGKGGTSRPLKDGDVLSFAAATFVFLSTRALYDILVRTQV